MRWAALCLHRLPQVPMSLPEYRFETLAVTQAEGCPGVLHVCLNRPAQRNAMNLQFWVDCRRCFQVISQDPEVRCVVLSGAGTVFSAGLDLQTLPEFNAADVGRCVKSKKNGLAPRGTQPELPSSTKDALGVAHEHPNKWEEPPSYPKARGRGQEPVLTVELPSTHTCERSVQRFVVA